MFNLCRPLLVVSTFQRALSILSRARVQLDRKAPRLRHGRLDRSGRRSKERLLHTRVKAQSWLDDPSVLAPHAGLLPRPSWLTPPLVPLCNIAFEPEFEQGGGRAWATHQYPPIYLLKFNESKLRRKRLGSSYRIQRSLRSFFLWSFIRCQTSCATKSPRAAVSEPWVRMNVQTYRLEV